MAMFTGGPKTDKSDIDDAQGAYSGATIWPMAFLDDQSLAL
jgi:hypothetical protein